MVDQLKKTNIFTKINYKPKKIHKADNIQGLKILERVESYPAEPSSNFSFFLWMIF